VWLKVLVLLLAAAYVVYRLGLAFRIARARRRGDTAREQALRRQAFWSFHAAVGVLLVGALLLLGLVALNER
jgi:hypothetical protein